MKPVTRVRGIRSPIPQGTILANSQNGEAHPVAHTTDQNISIRNGKISLNMKLTDAHIFVGGADGRAHDKAVSGDALLVDTGTLTVTGLQGVQVANTTPTNNQVLTYILADGKWEPKTLSGVVPGSITVAHNDIIVGNASNVGAAVAVSGDASIADTGALTVTKTNGVAFGYFATGTDAANLTGTVATGRIAGSYTGITGVGTLTAGTWNATTIDVAHGGTGAVSLTAHGILLGEGTGAVTPTAAMTNGQLLVGQTSSDPLPKTVSGDVTISAAGVTAIGAGKVSNTMLVNSSITLNGHSVSLGGSLSIAAGDLALTNTHILVGNVSNVAVDVALSGDATIANTGAITVSKTGGVAFGSFATGTDAANLTGTVASARISGSYTGITAVGTIATGVWNGTTVDVAHGGTGAATFTAHGIMLGEGTSALVPTAAMTNGQLLVGQTSADPLPKTVGGDATMSAAGALTVTKTNGVNFGSFATGTDAANLTGTVASARISGSYTGITAVGTIATGVWNGTAVDVAHGGTGDTTLTNHGVLVGAGTSAVTQLAVGANNTVLRGSTGADPAFGALVDADIPKSITGMTITYADGSAGSPTALWDTNRGFFNDTGNTAIGISVGGVAVGFMGATEFYWGDGSAVAHGLRATFGASPAAYAAGAQTLHRFIVTSAGDVGGTSNVTNVAPSLISSGTANLTTMLDLTNVIQHGSSGTLSTAIGQQTDVQATGGTITTADGYRSLLRASNAQNIVTGEHYSARAPLLTTSGTIGTVYGFRVLAQKISGVTTAWAFASDGASDNSYLAGKLSVGKTTAATQALDVTGNVAVTGVVTSGYQRITPITGFSQTISDNVSMLVMKPAGTLATGTVTMPANPLDGQRVTITSSQTITALTLSPNAGQTINGTTTTLSANTSVAFTYVATDTTWYKL